MLQQEEKWIASLATTQTAIRRAVRKGLPFRVQRLDQSEYLGSTAGLDLLLPTIASIIVSCCSNQTNILQPYFTVNPLHQAFAMLVRAPGRV
jgi:hypothetical protein